MAQPSMYGCHRNSSTEDYSQANQALLSVHALDCMLLLLLLLLCQATLEQVSQHISLQQLAMPPAEQILAIV
jgi:hypothetical protein